MRVNLKIVAALTLIVALTGCATSRVKTTTITYQGPNAAMRGTIYVSPGTEEQAKALSFNSVKNRIAAHLGQKGYQPVDDYENAQYVAYVNYTINNGKKVSESTPIFGQTGGGASFSSGTVRGSGGFATYSGSTYTAPTFGMVGVANTEHTEYLRQVQIDVFKVDGKKLGQKVYEIVGTSSGSCSNLKAVLPAIIDGMFEKFPGEDGKAQKASIYWDGGC